MFSSTWVVEGQDKGRGLRVLGALQLESQALDLYLKVHG